MRRTTSLLIISTCILLLLPLTTAHETRTYEIGGNEYEFVVGSLDEPIMVGQKTGVSLSAETAEGEPVEGLEDTLQVEIQAGDKARVFDLEAAFGDPGSYNAPFIPTVATTLTYRFFGTIEGTDVDLTFTCDDQQTGEGELNTQISEDVILVSRNGDFGCPASRADMGFPEQTPSLYELERDLDTVTAAAETAADEAASTASTARTLSIVALLAALTGIGMAGYTLRRER